MQHEWIKRWAPMTGLALGLAVLPGLGGCGFQPLYGQQSAQNVDVSHELERVFVANIPTRFGQEMRLALQQEMAGSDPEHPDGYVLKADGSAAFEAIDIHTDNTSGRTRVVGRAHWSLYTVGATPKLLAEGHAQTLDGFDPTIEQYFAQSLNNETIQQRVAQNLAHEMTQQVAIWFRSHVAPGKEQRVKPGEMPDIDSIPTDKGTPFHYLGTDGVPAAATGRQTSNSSLSSKTISTEDTDESSSQ